MNIHLSFQGTKIRHDREEASRKQAIKERQAQMKQKVRPNRHHIINTTYEHMPYSQTSKYLISILHLR